MEVIKTYASIYKIECKNSGRCYVGRTRGNFVHRKKEHLQLLRKGKHQCRLLQHDYDTYGENAFIFDVIDIEERIICNQPDMDLEKIWMVRLNTFNPNYGYNYCDPYFGYGTKNKYGKRKIIAEKYSFPLELL